MSGCRRRGREGKRAKRKARRRTHCQVRCYLRCLLRWTETACVMGFTWADPHRFRLARSARTVGTIARGTRCHRLFFFFRHHCWRTSSRQKSLRHGTWHKAPPHVADVASLSHNFCNVDGVGPSRLSWPPAETSRTPGHCCMPRSSAIAKHTLPKPRPV